MLEVKGTEQFGELRDALRKAGDRELEAELLTACRKAVEPVIPDVVRAAGRLPQAGGLSAAAAGARFSVRVVHQGVALLATAPVNLERLDRGKIRHPVWGQRDVWVAQRVKAGFWSDPVRADEPRAQAELEAAGRRIVAKVDKAVR